MAGELIRITDDDRKMPHKAKSWLTTAEHYLIENDEDYQQAAEDLGRIKEYFNEIEAWRKAKTKPLDDVKKDLMDFVRPVLDQLRAAENSIKGKMAKYYREQQEAAREAEAKQRKAVEAAETPEEVSQAMTRPVTPPKAKGVAVRETWKAEVHDVKALARAVAEGKVQEDLILPNTKVLNKLAAAQKDAFKVPGVEAVTNTNIARR